MSFVNFLKLENQLFVTRLDWRERVEAFDELCCSFLIETIKKESYIADKKSGLLCLLLPRCLHRPRRLQN